MKKLVVIFKNQLPPMQWIHPWNPSLTASIKDFGSIDGYFAALKECGLWDFENNKMLENHA